MQSLGAQLLLDVLIDSLALQGRVDPASTQASTANQAQDDFNHDVTTREQRAPNRL